MRLPIGSKAGEKISRIRAKNKTSSFIPSHIVLETYYLNKKRVKLKRNIPGSKLHHCWVGF